MAFLNVPYSVARLRGTRSPLERQIGRLLGDFFGEDQLGGTSASLNSKIGNFVPRLNVKDSKEAFDIEVELPGIDPNDVQINLKDGIMTLSGEKKYRHEEKDDGFSHVEVEYGQFTRTLELPNVEEDKLEAVMDNGVLKIHAPKAAQAKGAKKISIRKAN